MIFITIKEIVDGKPSLKEFLDNKENRELAGDQAFRLWTMMTGSTNVENAEHTEFSATQVVRKTSLSHRTANDLFEMLRAFGILEWTDMKKRTFRLHFTKKAVYRAIREDIVNVSKVVYQDVLRYITFLKTDKDLDDDARTKDIADLKNAVMSELRLLDGWEA